MDIDLSDKQTCDDCKNYMFVDYNVSDAVWADVVGGDGVFCIDCFVRRCSEKGILCCRQFFKHMHFFQLEFMTDEFNTRII